ncbi:helix-turn-helix transcriptional regulator [Actinoplanes sp. CA-142083]|uniref:helix-turn-helix transcriptional regulator n=1 Tax=Actinoplanes sp. CA-142083 TaxID=3239903 RepID=UPI003D9188EC
MAQRMTLSDRDVRTMLRVADPDDPAPSPGAEPWSVLHGLKALIPCDAIAFFQLDSDRRTRPWGQDLPQDGESDDTAFWEHYAACLPCSYPDHTGDLSRVTTFSDFYTLRELKKTGMYADYLRPNGVEREIMLCLPSPARRTVRLVLFRGPGADFGERDRALLTLLRPHLHRLRGTPDSTAGLTGRQRQLLGLVAAGYTNGQIASRLGLADSTVRKHLENAFDRLQVHSRAAAVALMREG